MKKAFFAFILWCLFFWPTPFWSACVQASELVEGRIVGIDPENRTVTVLDFFDGTEKHVAIEDIEGIKKDSVVRMWLSGDQDSSLKAEKIETVKKQDSAGMKRRLRKALGSMKRHGLGGRGHRGRCGRR